MPKRRWTDSQEKEIERQYREERISTNVLSRQYRCFPSAIWRIVNKWGKTRTKKESLNTDSYFELQKQNNPFYTPGKEHPSYKNGRTRCNGYCLILLEKGIHPFPLTMCRSEWIYEHRLIMENFLKEYDLGSEFLCFVDGFGGKWLDPKIIVHHKNGITDDNRVENLQIFKTNREHLSFHKHEQ